MSKTTRFGRRLALPSTLQIRREPLRLMRDDEIRKAQDKGEKGVPGAPETVRAPA